MKKNIFIAFFILISLISCSAPKAYLNHNAFSSSMPTPKHIALLLPLQGADALSGQMIKEGFLSARSAAPVDIQNQQTVAFYDTGTKQNITALYQQAITEGADMVIGPLTKSNVQELISQGNFTVPTLALNYTDLWFGSLPTNLYEFGLSPVDEAEQVADKAREAGRAQAILIAPQSEWGQRVAKALTKRFESNGGNIKDVFYFSEKSDLNKEIANLLHINIKHDREEMKKGNTKALLEQQRRQDFDVIFLLAPPESARQIVPLLKYYYAENIPVYATSAVYSGTPSPLKDFDLNGVIFCDIPLILSNGVLKSGPTNRLFAVGHDAYTLSRALPQLVASPNTPIYAETGALTLTPQGKIYRKLSWAQMHDGHP